MKKRQLWGLAALIVLLVFSVAWVGLLDKNDQHMKGTWTFWKDVEIKDDLTVTDDTVLTDDASVGGDLTVTGSLTIADELVLKVHSATTNYTHSFDDGQIILMTKAVGGNAQTSYWITLPTITEAMDGLIVILKQLDSETSPTGMVAAVGIDAIEASRGTATGVSDYTTDAAGDVKAWIADYSATSSVWRYFFADQA